MIDYPEILVECIRSANHPGNDLPLNEVAAASVKLYDEIMAAFDEVPPQEPAHE